MSKFVRISRNFVLPESCEKKVDAVNTPQLPDFRQLISEIHSGRNSQILSLLEEFWQKLLPSYRSNPKEAERHLLQFATGVVDSHSQLDNGNAALNEAYLTFVRALSSTEDPEVLYTPYCEFFQYAVSCFNRYSADIGFQKIAQIQSYMRSHLAEDLSLKEVADLFFLNPAYLSRLFKEKTGMTFSDYLAELRISCAKDLLNTTSQSILVIAQAVGYQEANSFSRLFKKRTGMSPQKFRNLNRTNARDGIPIPGGDFDMGPCIFGSQDQDMDYADAFLMRD